MNQKFTLAAILVALALLVATIVFPALPASSAPAAVPTPVTFSGASGNNMKVTFFNGSITADSRVCVDLSNYNKLDIQYIIDQGTVNTTTVKLQWSNDNVNYEDTATVVSANAADAHNGNQYLLFGTHNCIFADVTNGNALSIKVFGVAK